MRRIQSDVVRTPLLSSQKLDRLAGRKVFVKAECLQRTGSFKFRGAINRLRSLSDAELGKGVVAYSSGNHALAISEAALQLGVQACVIMPKAAPSAKVQGVQARGAEIIFYHDAEEREQLARQVVEATGKVFIAPFDDPFIMAGQGTGALEALEQLAVEQMTSDDLDVYIPCSGGGLASGWVTAFKPSFPSAEVFVVEPEGFDDTTRSLLSGERLPNQSGRHTMCDALMVKTPGALTFPILAGHRARGVVVSEVEVLQAMQFAMLELKVMLEPGGAAALAALLSGKPDRRANTAVVVASGGNVDRAILIEALNIGGSQS